MSILECSETVKINIIENMELNISNVVIEGLQILSKDLEMGKKLIANTVKQLITKEPNLPPKPELYANSPENSKQVEYSIAILYVLGVKHNYDSERLGEFLRKINIPEEVVDELLRPYINIFSKLKEKCEIYGYSLPHLRDVNWALSCIVRDSSELNYRINFGSFHAVTGTRATVAAFNCNIEELQSLINKLKDIERHCDKISKT